MSTSIKVKNETKKLLDELQAKILLSDGRKLSYQDLIDLLVNLGSSNFELLVDKGKSVSKATIQKIINKSTSWGIETNPEMIDEILYGKTAKVDES